MAHNARWCHSCGWSAHNQCGYIVSLQWRPRLVLCPPGGLLQLWPVVYATMCTSHFIVIFVLHCIQWFCTIALYFHLVFSLFVVCWYPYIFIDVLPCTLMFLCEIRAIKISYSYSYSYSYSVVLRIVCQSCYALLAQDTVSSMRHCNWDDTMIKPWWYGDKTCNVLFSPAPLV